MRIPIFLFRSAICNFDYLANDNISKRNQTEDTVVKLIGRKRGVS